MKLEEKKRKSNWTERRKGSSAADVLAMEDCVRMARRAMELGRPQWAVLISLTAGFGLRVGDAIALSWGDVMINGHVRSRITIREAKNRSQRQAGVFPWVSQTLEQVYRQLNPKPEDLIVPVTRQHAWWIIRRLATDLGIADGNRTISPHSLRKSYCSWIYEQTRDPILTCVLTGHKNPAMLLKYINRTPAKAEEILMAMSNARF